MKKIESLVIANFKSETDSVSEKTENTEPSPVELPIKYKYNYELKVGDDDRFGNKIEYIYENVVGEYLIYHIEDFDFQIQAEDQTLIGKNIKFNRLILQIGDYLSHERILRKRYITHIVHAFKNLYDGNEDVALDTLVLTYDNMTRYLKRRAIVPYLFGAFLLVLISLITYFVTYLVGNLDNFGHTIFSAIVLSSLGGFLSVAISLRNLDVDIQDKFWVKTLYGFVRILIAIISGVIMYFLIEGKVAFSFLKDNQITDTYYIAFFIAGFSERFVSNMLFSFEKAGDNKSDT